MRKDIHRPPHLYLDNATYFITASTMNRGYDIRRLKPATPLRNIAFEMDDVKLVALASLLQEMVKFYDFKLIGWVILRNHYHLLLEIIRGLTLPDFIKNLHGKSSFQFNKIDKYTGRKIWYQYWDTCITDEKTMYMRLNYIHNNPVKHGYAKDLIDYQYSSYHAYFEKFGREWLDDLWERYPVVDYIEADDFDGVARGKHDIRRLKPATPKCEGVANFSSRKHNKKGRVLP